MERDNSRPRACFVFSSRRRHTRYWRDWSSDVCSSDLRRTGRLPAPADHRRGGRPDRRSDRRVARGSPPDRGRPAGADRAHRGPGRRLRTAEIGRASCRERGESTVVVARWRETTADRVLALFFQAEDGIRDIGVTGVQTCALPISAGPVGFRLLLTIAEAGDPTDDPTVEWPEGRRRIEAGRLELTALTGDQGADCERRRSEERRVGKEGRARWSSRDGERQQQTACLLCFFKQKTAYEILA